VARVRTAPAAISRDGVGLVAVSFLDTVVAVSFLDIVVAVSFLDTVVAIALCVGSFIEIQGRRASRSAWWRR
jgi:energy-converting hydrogenase Eha subunit C